jgi:hypothetical protein
MREKADSRLLFEEWVNELLPFSFLIGFEQDLPALIGKQNSAGFSLPEIGGAHLTQIDQREDQAIGEPRPQLFHQVQGQTGPTGPVAVEEPDGRIKTNRLDCALNVVDQQGVNERKERIHSVTWWSATPLLEAERFFLLRDQMIEDLEVAPSRETLEATERIHVASPLTFVQESGEAACDRAQCGCPVGIGAIAGRAEKDCPGVG